MINFSNRIQSMQQSPIRKLSGDAQKIKEKGVKVFNLNVGQPDLKISKDFFKALHNYKSENLDYTNSEGIYKLRETISNYYKHYSLDFNAEDILITNGASEAILFSLLATCDSGDNILIPEPFYTNYLNFAKAADVKVKGIPTDSNNGYSLESYKTISSKIDKNTKAILLSNPSNPTGRVYTNEEINIIKSIALENNLWVIADEVYRDFIYDDSKFTSFASIQEIEDRVILIDSASKRFSACGARIGCIASKNKPLLREILKLCQTRLCVPTLEQIGTIELYKNSPLSLEKDRLEYSKRRDLLFNELSTSSDFICKKPKGAFYLMVKIPNVNTEDFAKWLVNNFTYNNETVLISPAKGFYSTEGLGVDEIRLSYVLNTEDLKKACTILKEGIKEYKKNKLFNIKR